MAKEKMPEQDKKNILKTDLSKVFKVKESEKTTLLLVLVFLIVVGCGYFIFLPIQANYREQKVDIENTKREKQAFLDRQVALEELGRKIEARRVFIDQVKDVLPEKPEVPELVVTLEKLASSNGMYIDNFIPKVLADLPQASAAQTEQKEYQTIELQFNLTGTYSNMKKFVSDLEKNIRPVDIITIAINSESAPTQASDIVRFNIKANTYYQQ